MDRRRIAGEIIAPQRTSSAHLHRPWRAISGSERAKLARRLNRGSAITSRGLPLTDALAGAAQLGTRAAVSSASAKNQSTTAIELSAHQSRNARSVAFDSNSYQRSRAFLRISRARNFR